MKEVVIYTDGACSGNPGPGGYGAILIYGKAKKEISGGEGSTTNNRMEMMGVIKGLEELKEPCKVTLYTDSAYVANSINKGWMYGWKKSNWTKKNGVVKNIDLWKIIDKLLGIHDVTVNWVKGHADDKYNNRCDELAVKAREKFCNQ